MRRLATALALFQGSSIVSTAARIIKAKVGAVILGPEGVAVLAQLGSFTSLVTTGSGLGMANGLIRRVAESRRDEDWIGLRNQISTVLMTLLGVSIFVTTVSAGFSVQLSHWLLNDDGIHAPLVAIALIAVPMSLLAMVSRGVLNGLQLPKEVVASELIAELGSLALFVILVIKIGLLGACISLVALQVLRFVALQRNVRRHLGSCLPPFSWRQFHFVELNHNMRFGAVGLFLVSVGILTTLTVTRWVIENHGLDEGGVFSVAWKVSAVYLGALYAAASNYLFPGLVRALKDGSSNERLNEALTLYAYVIPPMVVGVLIGGEWLVRILFSSEFAPAAALLLFLLPADLLRVSAETTGLSLLAKASLIPYATVYLLWAGSFLLLSSLWLPTYGLAGVGIAYVISQALNLGASVVLGRIFGSAFWNRASIVAIVRGIVLLSFVSWIFMTSTDTEISIVLALLAALIWLVLTVKDEPFKRIFQRTQAGEECD